MIVPRDMLQVTVFEAPELSGETRVSETGDIVLPLLGVLRAGGQTPRELEESIAIRLRGTYMHDPHVAVEVTEEATRPVYVLGEVNQPGAFPTSDQAPMTLLRAISVAEGLAPGAARGGTLVIRTTDDGSRIRLPVDIDEVLVGRAPDMVLQPNDVVYVPKSKGRAVALGVIDALVRVVTFRTVF